MLLPLWELLVGTDNLHHKRKAKKEADHARKKAKRENHTTVLIVCEGTKTEPNFFMEMVADLKIPGVVVDVIPSPSTCPLRLAEFAENSNADREYDYVYCVFDKDEHNKYYDALRFIEEHDDWLIASNSVPCFEYWLILHFEYTTQPFYKSPKESSGSQVVSYLKNFIPKYEKGNGEIYAFVKDNTHTAIGNAKRANQAAKETKTDTPSTTVVDLVQFLTSLCDPSE